MALDSMDGMGDAMEQPAYATLTPDPGSTGDGTDTQTLICVDSDYTADDQFGPMTCLLREDDARLGPLPVTLTFDERGLVRTVPGLPDPLPAPFTVKAAAAWFLGTVNGRTYDSVSMITLSDGTTDAADQVPSAPVDCALNLPPNVLALIASRLGIASAALNPSVAFLEYTFAAARLVAAWPCIGDPATLTYPDSLFFSGASALVVAARLFGPLTTGEGGKILKLTSADGDSVTYSAPPAASPEGWLTEAQDFLYQVSCVKNSLAASSSSFNFFRAGNDHRLRRCGLGGELYGAGLLYGAGMVGLLDYGLYPLQSEYSYGAGYGYYGG